MFALLAGVFSLGSRAQAKIDVSFQFHFALSLLLLTSVSFCLAGASIAYDRKQTIRCAGRGALNAFYVWSVLILMLFMR